MTPLIQWASKISSAGGKYDLTEFHWFDATNVMMDFFQLQDTKDFERYVSDPLPFKNMFICLSVRNNKMIIRLQEEEKDGLLMCAVAAIGQKSDGTSGSLGAFSIFKRNGKPEFTPLTDTTTEKDVQYVTTIISNVQRRLQTCTTQVYKPYDAKPFINQKRLKKGKPLSYEWRTVIVEPKVVVSVSHGGTHASPRLHDRRGHWRTMKKSGKRVWVKECKVGDPSKGVVFHDYKFSRQTV